MHPSHAEDIITKHKKHVVIEKPMYMNMKDKKRLADLSSKYGVKIFPVFQNRYNKAVKKVKSGLEKQMFGKLVMGSVKLLWSRPQRYYDRDPWRGKWSMDGGALTNQGIHYLDLLRWF
ncbi:MAG: Gfo/Idh/MocA family oxidoreductase, partial [Candidatus Margulisiibacteriota bacterium]